MPFRFIHTADIHLDSPLRSLALRNRELAELIGDSTRQALVAIVGLCLEEQVDALIIAGDLYDGDQTSMKTARFLVDQMERLHQAGISVYTIRGNHDSMSKITRELILPPSVKVFGSHAEMIEVRSGSLEVAIHGLSFSRPHAPDSLLPKFTRPAPDAANIGIMHTSLAGAQGHDPYAPCNVSDLHGWGFDYWALGHIHARAQHAGERTVIMAGIPQGRDINEAGAKTVTLVTVKDDKSIAIDERQTAIAQFERVAVDVSGASSWRAVVDTIERNVTGVRDQTAADHLVGRLLLKGETSLSWRIRRDRDLLHAEVEHRMQGLGRTWIEKIELATTSPMEALSSGTADPVVELGELMRTEIIRQHGIREAVRHVVKELIDDLPPEARSFSGNDETQFEAFVDQLLVESGEDIIARMKHSDRTT